jgi:Fe2+ transport system protein FeoA
MVYEVIDVPQSDPCQNCTSCMRLKLMEMGFIPGQIIEVEKKRFGLLVVHMLTKSGQLEQTIALRPEELGRICMKEILFK